MPVVASKDPLVSDANREVLVMSARRPRPRESRRSGIRTGFGLPSTPLFGETGTGGTRLLAGRSAVDPDAEGLLRRHGLPPSPEAVQAYEGTPEAYEKAGDDLLESSGFGEHWGAAGWTPPAIPTRKGQVSADAIRPNAWRYRDYVIRSSTPTSRTTVPGEQIAGDELFDYKAADELTAEQRELLVGDGVSAHGSGRDLQRVAGLSFPSAWRWWRARSRSSVPR